MTDHDNQIDWREQAIQRLKRRYALRQYNIVFFTLTVLFISIWILTTPGGFFWPIFPILALLLAYAGFFDIKKISELDIEKEIERQKGESKNI